MTTETPTEIDHVVLPLGGARGDGKFVKIPQSSLHLVLNRSVSLDTHGYARICLGGKPRLLHRLIMNANPGQLVDHINGDPLDNRLENLRICSHAENMRNRKPNGGRRWKGISRRGNGWRAHIKVNGRTICLGTYPTDVEAARAYDRAAIQYHGAFARLNFPQDAQQPSTA